MDPSVCGLHPGVAVTGFCPACLRDRLAGLQPPSSADLRRCKSFSYARSAAAHLEPQRRSCDLFRQEPIPAAARERMEEHSVHPQEPSSRKSLGGLLGKKLQQWRRRNKKDETMPVPPPEMPGRHRHQRPCDVDPRRASWDARSVLARLPATMLSLPVEEDQEDMAPVPRSDGQIPVEEDYYYGSAVAVPGGSAQTRDYYLDSSSSSRRRRSLDRSTASGRNSFSDANNNGELMMPMLSRTVAMAGGANGNARVSPAIAAELYQYHHRYCSRDLQPGPSNLRDDDFSRSFGSAFRDHTPSKANKAKKGIKGWSIWGLIHKKSSSSKCEADHHGPLEAAAAAGGEYPWPELRARGYNGQMLRCSSSVSARSSFSGGAAAAMIGGSGRRSTSSGVEMPMHDVKNGVERRMRRDEVLLERNMSTSRSRSAHLDPPMPMGVHQYQFSRPPNPPASGNKGRKSSSSNANRRSTLGLY